MRPVDQETSSLTLPRRWWCQVHALASQAGPTALRWAKWLVGIRLGVLRQHAPRPLRLPGYVNAPPRLASPPVISLVTPSFNQGAYLERTIQSVLRQRYPRLEFIIQDGGSTDNTPQVLERYRGDLTRCESSADGGQADAINRGFRHATGEILAFLNSDDILLPGALAAVAECFAAHPEVDVLYGHRVLIDVADREIGRWIMPPHDGKVLTWVDYVPQETLFWRRSLWERTGGRLDDSFQFALDWDMLLRFRDAGARFRRLPRFLGGFRVHADQKTTTHIGVGTDEMERLRRRSHGRSVSGAEIRWHALGFLLRHAVYHRLYQLGLFAGNPRQHAA